MDGGRDGVGVEDGVGEFEEGVGSALETFVERAAEAVESVVGFHDAPIVHSPRAPRILYLPMELKRKLRACANREPRADLQAGTGCPIIRGVAEASR